MRHPALGAGVMTSMANPFDDDDAEFLVLVNDEDQFSLWPAVQEIPAGWSATGPSGARADCLAWIDEHWTDMRPKSLRLAMDDTA
jgi:MbtH protein